MRSADQTVAAKIVECLLASAQKNRVADVRIGVGYSAVMLNVAAHRLGVTGKCSHDKRATN